jgi:hypothetical protein
MGRCKLSTRGRALPVVVAGTIGYLIGGWHPVATQGQVLTAAESVAQRFPQQWDSATLPAGPADIAPPAGVVDGSAMSATSAMDDTQFALLNPEPMVPQADRQAVAPTPQQPTAEAAVEPAAAEHTVLPPALGASEIRTVARAAAVTPPPRPVKMPAITPARAGRPAAHRLAMDRPGYMLDDAQIASIKERLHLTPDQEQMWPAVEAALRNIAYTRAQQAHRRDIPAGGVQMADVDAESVEGLKSAAVPLIMSFNEEQKQEVRNLAHVMGLDRLASEF